MRSPRRLLAATVLLATAFAGTPALISSADAAPDPGDRAVARAADNYGVSEEALRARLKGDSSLRLTSSGLAYFIDPAPPATKQEPAKLLAQNFPPEQTFFLHSKPDSQRTIYLDFDGGDVSDTLWNGPSGGNLPNGTHPAMDLAGNGNAFTSTELAQIQDIYLRVAEDFAPFDVDVTTEEPPAADIERTNSSDQVYGTRAMISSSDTALAVICGGNCGGVAFIGVFNHYPGKDGFTETHGEVQPAWVFPQALGEDPKNIAEATTHEVGHNLGLDHDGTNSLGYYDGAFNGSWAPIMGVGYNQPVAQFALSDYPDANLGGPGAGSLQTFPFGVENADDFAVIVGYGAPIRADEVGTSTGTRPPCHRAPPTSRVAPMSTTSRLAPAPATSRSTRATRQSARTSTSRCS